MAVTLKQESSLVNPFEPPVLVSIQEQVHISKQELARVIKVWLNLVLVDVIKLVHSNISLLFDTLLILLILRLGQVLAFIQLFLGDLLIGKSNQPMNHHEKLVGLLLIQVTLAATVKLILAKQEISSFFFLNVQPFFKS